MDTTIALERTSKDGRFEFTLCYSNDDKRWYVDCWKVADQSNYWNRSYSDYYRALAEYNRFE
jgi:hypothetical protein